MVQESLGEKRKKSYPAAYDQLIAYTLNREKKK